MNVFTKSSSFLYNSPLSGIFRLFSSHPERYKKWDNPFDDKAEANRSAEEERNARVEEPEVLEGEVFYMDEQKRMDEILKKVSREGINSLTDSERQFLLRAGDRIRRRRGGM
jgi:hypothetical protein